MRGRVVWRVAAVLLAARAAPATGWSHARAVCHRRPAAQPRTPSRVLSAGLAPRAESLGDDVDPKGSALRSAAPGNPSELSWESAVARFGLLPKALLKQRQRDDWIGRRLAGMPGVLMIRRTSQIWGFISAVVVKRALSSTLPGTPDDERRLARECKEGLLALGPTFIKLGQLLSTRVDVMPPAFIDELSTLQDQCPPFALEQVLSILDAELGPGAFAHVDPKPLAAASLGQVHLATTREGERVCVKVQRPGLEELFRVDLKNLQLLSEVAMQLDRTPDRVLRDWREIFAQNARILFEEVDYTLEAGNAERFAANFAAVPWLRVPKIYRAYSTARVLTMEYVPGVKVTALARIDELGLDRPQLATFMAEAYLLQLLRFGCFHADPHAGNVAVEPMPGGPAGAGRLILYDYGMMGTLSPQVRMGQGGRGAGGWWSRGAGGQGGRCAWGGVAGAHGAGGQGGRGVVEQGRAVGVGVGAGRRA